MFVKGNVSFKAWTLLQKNVSITQCLLEFVPTSDSVHSGDIFSDLNLSFMYENHSKFVLINELEIMVENGKGQE